MQNICILKVFGTVKYLRCINHDGDYLVEFEGHHQNHFQPQIQKPFALHDLWSVKVQEVQEVAAGVVVQVRQALDLPGPR